ncbi:MAG: hypothetical protein ACXWWC_00445 [Chitinophagaceae bacterium]
MKTNEPKKDTAHLSILFLLLLTTFTFSCVSIQPSTVQLSAQVGERMSEMEKLHQLAIQRYFDMEKEKVENFLTNTWEPLFLKNFLGTSGVLQLLQNVSKIDERGKNILKEGITEYLTDKSEAEKAANDLISRLNESRKGEEGAVRTVLNKYVEDKKLDAAVIHISSLLGTDEPARIIFDFAEAAHREMQVQRKEMLAPIEQARTEAVASLSEAYAELIRGQSTITGRLQAAGKRSKQQDELLDKLGIGQITKEVTTRLANVSSKVDKALSVANNLIDKGKNNNADSILNSLRSSLNNIPDSSMPPINK